MVQPNALDTHCDAALVPSLSNGDTCVRLAESELVPRVAATTRVWKITNVVSDVHSDVFVAVPCSTMVIFVQAAVWTSVARVAAISRETMARHTVLYTDPVRLLVVQMPACPTVNVAETTFTFVLYVIDPKNTNTVCGAMCVPGFSAMVWKTKLWLTKYTTDWHLER